MLTVFDLRLVSVLNILILLVPIYQYSILKEKRILNTVLIFGGLSLFGLFPSEKLVSYWYNFIPLFLMFLVLNEQKFLLRNIRTDKISNFAFLYLIVFVVTFGLELNILFFNSQINYFQFLLYGTSIAGFLIAGINFSLKQHIGLSIFLVIFSLFWVNFKGAYCMLTILGYLIYTVLTELKMLLSDHEVLHKHMKRNTFSAYALVEIQLKLKKLLELLKTPQNQKEEEVTEIISEAITKGDDYLFYLDERKPVYEHWEIKPILDNAIYFLKKANILNDKFTCKVTYHGDIAQTHVDMFQMNQLFYNLITNAVESMEDGGIVYIDVQNIENNGMDLVEISVHDTGKGIPEESLLQVFDSHYSTKGKFIKGMGLSRCKQIIENHNGFIKVKSEIGKGTTFFVYLKPEKVSQ